MASTTFLPDTRSSTRAYSPLGMIQVSTTAIRMMTTRMTKVWGMVKPFFFVCRGDFDDMISSSFIFVTHAVFPPTYV